MSRDAIPHPDRPRPSTRRAQKVARDTASAMRRDGFSHSEIASALNVTRVTVSRWLDGAQPGDMTETEDKDRLIARIQIRLASPDTPPQYFTPLASLLADLQGWKRDTKDGKEIKPLGDLFEAWHRERANGDSQEVSESRLASQGVSAKSHDSLKSVSPGEPPIEAVTGANNSSPTAP